MDPICPSCGKRMVEVDNPIRREIRHRRGEEVQCPAWRDAAGLPPTSAAERAGWRSLGWRGDEEIVLAAIAIARMTSCIVSVGRYQGSASSVEFWQPHRGPHGEIAYRYWAFIPKVA